MITEDVHCMRCGYNLRGLDESGACPECAAPVADSLRGDLLRFADRKWLDRAYRGMALIVTAHNGVLVGFFAIFIIFGVLAAMEAAGVIQSPAVLAAFVPVLILAIMAALGATLFAGLLLLADPEPREFQAAPLRSRATRTLHMASVPSLLIWYLITYGTWAPYEIAEAVSHVFAVLISMHVVLAFREAEGFEKRCTGFVPARRRTLRHNRIGATVLAGVPLLFHWVFDPNPVFQPSEPLTPWFHFVIWILCLGTYQRTMRSVRREVRARDIVRRN